VANVKLTGTPVNISANSLQMNFSELQALLTGAFEAHKASRPDRVA
jgi:hypothetical protein